MDPRPRLIQAASKLQRRIFASMPMSYRIAHVIFELRLGGNVSDTLGRLCYGIFLMEGVEGMPDAPFTPKSTREIDRLPKDYGKDFGKRLESRAKKFTGGDPNFTEDILGEMWMKLLTQNSLRDLVRGKKRQDAENIVDRSLQNSAKDMLKHRAVRRHDNLEEVIDTPANWDELGEILLDSEREEIIEDLEDAISSKVTPDLPLYFKLIMEGYSNSEISEQQMLPSLKNNPLSHQTLAKYRNAIRDVLQKHVEKRDRIARCT